MRNYCEIELDTWKRAKIYKSFMAGMNPFINITTMLNVKKIYKYSKDNKLSFFQLTLFAILKSVNYIPELKQRTLSGKPVEFDKVDAITPVKMYDNNFTDIICSYCNSFSEFTKNVTPIINKLKNTSENAEIKNTFLDCVGISCVPFLNFQALSTPFSTLDDIPRIAYGKMCEYEIPINLFVNHAFVDGYHLAKFFETLQNNFNHPDKL